MPDMGNYSPIDHGGQGIGGGIGGMAGHPARVSVYIEVDDPEAYMAKVTAAGGTQTMPVTPVAEGVTFGMFSDPDGNSIGLMKARAR